MNISIENRCIQFREIERSYGLISLQSEWYSRCYFIAEDMIKEEASKNPARERFIYNSFWALCPTTVIFKKMNSDFYKAHCAELLNRIIQRQDLQPATLAECLSYLTDLVLKQTLDFAVSFSMFYLFQQICMTQAQSEFLKFFENDTRLHQRKDEIIYDLRLRLMTKRGVKDIFFH